jgi:hypothetical protein
MNLLLTYSDQMAFYTDMRAVFDTMPGVCESHDWLISDLDCHALMDDRPPEAPVPGLAPSAEKLLTSDSRILLPGNEFREALDARDIQFVWAVFSALEPGTRPDTSRCPCADGNPDFWKGSPKPQLREALFEIVCWDSGSTMLIGVPDRIAERFTARFTDAVDLDRYNRKRKSPETATSA